MKRVTFLLMAIFLMSVSVPVIAADMTKAQKNECLLASKGCKDTVDSIQQKIKKLQTEIKKGKKEYTADELNKLNAKLKEADELLNQMMSNP
jgi:septal ring factor EnvC (AmiA/AmiB activator)